MKTHSLYLLTLLSLLIGCKKDDNELDGFSIKIQNDFVLTHNEFDYYDYSAHLIYLKKNNTFLNGYKPGTIFEVFSNEQRVYSGLLHPTYSSNLPQVPIINTNSFFYSNYIIPIDFPQIVNSEGELRSDPRNNDRIILALKKYQQLHKGLTCEIKSIQFLSKKNISIQLELTNDDAYNYYYLDPDKMGSSLYHHFSHGLVFYDYKEQQTYTHTIVSTPPEPWDKWSIEWMNLLKSGETRTILINYNDFDFIPQGQYKVFFEFPGLTFQVKKSEIQLEEGKIWLGELKLFKDFVVE